MPETGDAQPQTQKAAALAIQAKFEQGTALHQQGRLAEAERIYREILQQQPYHFDALHLLGVIALQNRHTERAVELISKAIGLMPNYAEAFNNRGIALLDLRRPEDALASFDRAIALKSDYAEAFGNRGNSLLDLKRPEDALASFDRAIELKPDSAELHNNRGNALLDSKHPEDALASFDKAIALKPNYAEGYNNRGNALLDSKRPEDALASFEKAIALKPDYAEGHNNRGNALLNLKRPEEALASFERAVALKPDYAEAYFNCGNVLRELRRPADALTSYAKAIALKPDYAEAHNNCGIALRILRRPLEAVVSSDKAVALKPNFAEAYSNRGLALLDLKRPAEALASYDKAIALKQDFAMAHSNRGWALATLNRYNEAFYAFDKAYALDPDITGAEGDRLHAKMRVCDWSNFDSECAHLIASVRNENASTPPFIFLAIPSSSAEQLQCAKVWNAREYPSSQHSVWQCGRYDHKRIRIAYLSADFHQHAMAFLTAGMFECHDRSRFDVTAISFGQNDNSAMRRRLEASFDRFIEAQSYSDDQIADLVRALEIDLSVDLMGFTTNSRTGIFARRPAPVQINYLGYPGTMSAEYIDYIMADRIVIPEDQRAFYAEKIAYLPDSYQVNDAKRLIADRAFTRSELGLPPTGFVFCCFNNNYKITPGVFDCWMRVLKQVEGSILWLLEVNPTATGNLRAAAAARGVNAERLIFSKHMPPADHLARYRLADLFLDTAPYNAHTTASDALWAELPVLTLLGETFAGRVAASLLNAVGLPELVTTTSEAYERTAIELATQPEKLAMIKAKLAENRPTTPLFDTKRFTTHIEAAYTAMYERQQAGLQPDHIYLPR